ncbi:GAF domain-containing protein [Candidatus Desantisbacteria bacterium]|nr:GAF domain-containing protein [Candidatus Desantisbacteria bacterium]
MSSLKNKINMSIRSKLISMFLAVASIPLVFISVLTFTNYRNSLEVSRISQLKNIAALKADKIETYFERLKEKIKIAQSFYNIRKNLPIMSRLSNYPSNPEFISAKKTLDEQLKQVQSILSLSDIMLVNTEGNIIYASDPDHYQKEFLNPFSYQKAFREGKNKIYLSDIFSNKTKRYKPVMLITASASDLTGAFAGVIAFEVDLITFYKIVRDTTGLGNTGEILLGKKIDNKIIFLNSLRHDPKAALTRKVQIGESLGGPIQEAAQGKTGSGQLIDYRGKKVIAAWRYIPALGWGIVAKIDTEEAFAEAINLRNITIITLSIIFVLGGIIAFPIAQLISKPLKKLSMDAEIIGKGNLDYKISINSNDEIGQLSKSLEKMAHDLKKTIASRDKLDGEITIRKQIERSLKLTTHKYLAILQTSQSGYMLCNMEGKIIEVNDAYSQMTGYNKDELLKMYISDLEPDRNSEEIYSRIKLIREKGHLRFEHRNRCKDGTINEFEINTAYLDIDSGFVAVFMQDITERKKSDRIKQSHIRMLETGNKETASLDEILQVTLNEIEALTNSNIGFYHFLNEDQETLSLQQWSTNTIQKMCTAEGKGSHYPISKAGIWVDCVRKKRPVIHNDYESMPNKKGLPNGHAPIIREMIIPITMSDKIVAIIGVGNKATDYNLADIEITSILGNFSWEIVKRRRAEDKLHESEKNLRRSNENLEQFAYVASHDLQEPLRMMASFSELLKQRYNNLLDKDADEFIEYIVDGAKRMQRLINDLLTYSRIDNIGKSVGEINCNLLIGKIINSMIPAIDASKAIITYDQLPVLTGNESNFIQLFQNLIGNAIKFHGSEPPRIHISAVKKPDEWLFLVKDNGIGIESQYKDRIFLIFQRLHGRDKYPGTGIGLAICKKIIETLGGRIWVGSEENKGSAFYFTLPIKGGITNE